MFDPRSRSPGREHQVQRLARPYRIRAEHGRRREALLADPLSHTGRVAPAAGVQRALVVGEHGVAPVGLGMADQEELERHRGWNAFIWNADCSGSRRPAPTGQARRTRQPLQAVWPGVEEGVAGRDVVALRTERADRTGREAGRRAGLAGPLRRDGGRLLRQQIRPGADPEPAWSWTRRPTARPGAPTGGPGGEGRQGGPRGEDGLGPERQAIRPITRATSGRAGRARRPGFGRGAKRPEPGSSGRRGPRSGSAAGRPRAGGGRQAVHKANRPRAAAP
jgi:hypothetical protein